MPSNYTIAKALGRVSYYKQLCGEDPHHYAEGGGIVQGLTGMRLDDVYNTAPDRLPELFPEADAEFFQTLGEIIEGKEIAVLKEGAVPLTLLDITDIKGVGAKTVAKMHSEMGIVDLPSLMAKVDSGELAKTKGFGPKLVEKIQTHQATLEKKAKK